jgi:hypothetical protein
MAPAAVEGDTVSVISYQYDRADALALLRSVAGDGADLVTFECSCGCNAAVHFANSPKALWVVSELSDDGKLHASGLENRREVDALIAAYSRPHDPAIGGTHEKAAFAVALRAAWRKRRG